MIKAVVFDLGGVLEIVDDDRWLDGWVARWERRADVAPGTYGRAAVGLGPVSTEGDLRRRIQESLGLTDSDADHALRDFWDGYCGELDEAMRDFVLELRQSLIVAALSNSADGARREDDRRYGFDTLFDERVYSHEVGLEKPDPAIYELLQRRLGVAPHEIVFVDDRAAAVDGARSVGWHAILHESAPRSIAAVREVIRGLENAR